MGTLLQAASKMRHTVWARTSPGGQFHRVTSYLPTLAVACGEAMPLEDLPFEFQERPAPAARCTRCTLAQAMSMVVPLDSVEVLRSERHAGGGW